MRGFGGVGGWRGVGGLDIAASTSALKASPTAPLSPYAQTQYASYSLESTNAALTGSKALPSATRTPVDAAAVAAGLQAAGTATATIFSAVSANRQAAYQTWAAGEAQKRQQKQARRAAKAAPASPMPAPAPASEGFPWMTALIVAGAVGGVYLLTRRPGPPPRFSE